MFMTGVLCTVCGAQVYFHLLLNTNDVAWKCTWFILTLISFCSRNVGDPCQFNYAEKYRREAEEELMHYSHPHVGHAFLSRSCMYSHVGHVVYTAFLHM